MRKDLNTLGMQRRFVVCDTFGFYGFHHFDKIQLSEASNLFRFVELFVVVMCRY